jgi:hypothetical protein
MIIGGETIKMLQQKTGCRIQVSKDEGQPMRDITLTGGPREQEFAQKEILALAGQVCDITLLLWFTNR